MPVNTFGPYSMPGSLLPSFSSSLGFQRRHPAGRFLSAAHALHRALDLLPSELDLARRLLGGRTRDKSAWASRLPTHSARSRAIPSCAFCRPRPSRYATALGAAPLIPPYSACTLRGRPGRVGCYSSIGITKMFMHVGSGFATEPYTVNRIF